MTRTRWKIATPCPSEELASLGDLPPLLAQLLHNRGIRSAPDAQRFLDPACLKGDPFQLVDIHAAVSRIRQAIRGEEPIAIYGDYDADGVTSTALLMQTLRALGARVTYHIPHRVREGYGLNKRALDRLAKRGAKLIVTVDCGVRAVDEVAFARRRGLDVVITDHHEVVKDLPAARALVNPKRTDSRYPYHNLAGVGVSYKLAQALLRVEAKVPVRRGRSVSLEESDLLDLVALGTVADVVPLLGENRTLVWQGLQALNAARRPGIAAMLQEARVQPGQVEAWTIGYVLGPRINAAGRLDTAKESLELLTTEDVDYALQLAAHLGARNQERQEMTKQLLDEAREDALAQGVGYLIAIGGKQYLAGVAGLVAGHLTREFYRPAVVLELGDEFSKASCRSIPEFHITEALDACADLLVRHGGHAEAAGFTIRTENWPTLTQRLQKLAAEKLDGQALLPTLEIDAEIPLSLVNRNTLRLVDQLQPLGHGNRAPVFCSRGVEVAEHRLLKGKHLQLKFRRGYERVPAIAFNKAELASRVSGRVDVAYRMQLNEWNGRSEVQMVVEDLRKAADD